MTYISGADMRLNDVDAWDLKISLTYILFKFNIITWFERDSGDIEDWENKAHEQVL